MIFELHNKQMLENVTNPWPGKKFKYQLDLINLAFDLKTTLLRDMNELLFLGFVLELCLLFIL